MFKVKGLSFSYAAANNYVALKNIDLKINQGEFVVVTGKSGCGKTSLTRIFNGLIPLYYKGTLEGCYVSDYFHSHSMNLYKYANWVGSIFQDPRSQFFAKTPKSEIVFPMENGFISREEMHLRYSHTVEKLAIKGLVEQSIFSLSSGEKQKVAIASVCCMKPKLIVLDEPSSNLDLKSIEALKHILEELKNQGITILLSEHRFSYAYDLLDRFILMENGRIKEKLTRNELLQKSSTFYSHNGLRSPIETSPSFNEVESIQYTYRQDKGLALNDICFSKSRKSILKAINLWIKRGSVIGITGNNGAGKSTLCKIISGIEKPTKGSIMLDGLSLKRKSRLKRSFYAGQDADYQLYAAHVGAELAFNDKKVTQVQMDDMLKKVGLHELINRHPLSLSGGQKQRLLIAVAMLKSDKDIIILDEPTSGLDAENMSIIASLIDELKKRNKIILLITHDMELINKAADELIFMKKGCIVSHKSLIRKEVMDHEEKI